MNKDKTKQLDLSLPAEYLAEREKHGEFTGERLKKRKPELYQACVSLLGSGAALLQIAKLLKISVNTVSAVKQREQISIEMEKRLWADKFRTVAGLSAERAMELLADDDRAKDIPLNQLAIATGIFTEKAELLSGGATSRVDWVQPSPSADDYNQFLSDLRRANAVDADLIEDNGSKQPETETKGEPGPNTRDLNAGDSESHANEEKTE